MPFNSSSAISAEYNRIADRYDSFYGTANNRYENEFLSRYLRDNRQGDPACVVDLGCGTALGLRLLSEGLDEGEQLRYCGIDIAEEMIENASYQPDGNAALASFVPGSYNSPDTVLRAIDAVRTSSSQTVTVLSLWSLYYSSPIEIRALFSGPLSGLSEGSRFIAALPEDSALLADSEYIHGGSSRLRLTPRPAILGVLHSVFGWEVEEVVPVRGPFASYAPGPMKSLADNLDRSIFTNKDRFRFIVVRMVRR